MRFITLAVVCVAISMSLISCGNQKDEKVNSYDFIGEVKSIKKVSYEPIEKFGELQNYDEIEIGNINSYSRIVFNRDGYRALLQSYSGLGIQESMIETEFKDGIPYKGNAYEESPEVQKGYEKLIYEGELVKEREIYNMADVLQGKIIRVIDDSNRVVEVNRYDQEGDLEYKSKRNYIRSDSIRNVMYDSDGEYFMEWNDLLNERGEIKSNRFRLHEDEEFRVETYKYVNRDEKGNWIERHTYNNEGKIDEIIKREIEYYDGSVFGNVEIRSVKNDVEATAKLIADEMQEIADKAESFYFKPEMLGGGGQSFNDFEFNVLSHGGEFMRKFVRTTALSSETDISKYVLQPQNNQLRIFGISKFNNVVVRGTVSEDSFDTETFDRSSAEVQQYLD